MDSNTKKGNPLLLSRIRDEITANGRITFARFMEMALYDPEYGYYTSGREIVGTAGDYLTSPAMHPLPYAYNALEPYYDEETLHLHHDKHHAAYVNGLNAAEDKVQAMLKSGDFAGARAVAGELAFNGSGNILHTIFWPNMKPEGGGEPTGELADMINRQFGSYDAFKGLFLATANSVQGSGWGILAYRKTDDALVVLGAEKHENLTQWGVKPILVLDVWEHAYYLKYQNKRPEWTKTFMEHLVNWDNVAENLKAAKG